MRRLPALLLSAMAPLTALTACTAPPPEAYVSRGSGRAGGGEPVGADARGDNCVAQDGRALPADQPLRRSREVYCGGWTQPAARVLELSGPAGTAQLDALAAGGLWRTWLDQRASCGAPQPTTLAGGVPARLLACSRRVGGWPHVAIVAAGPNGPVLADGVSTAAPVIERLATGRAAEASRDGARSAALELAVSRLSADAFGTADVSRYEELMSLGSALNQVENFGAAEDAYRAALAVHERILGRDNPNSVAALIHLAVNLSNQRRFEEAEILFERADTLAPRASDPVTPARLLHYRGLDALNRGQPTDALALLERAETAYAALAPAGAVAGASEVALVADPVSQSALLGLAEARRNRALALVRAGRPSEAPALVAEARRILRNGGLELNMTVGRVLRTQAGAALSAGRTEAAARLLEQAAGRFAVAAPGERPEAVTLFLAGDQRLRAGRRDEALAAFRTGAGILRARQVGLPVDLVIPYLDALDAEVQANAANAAALQAEMFAAAQLAQRGGTARLVQQAAARLGVADGDRRVSGAVRSLQDADRTLRELFAERDALTNPSSELDERIAAAQARRAEAEAEVAAAAPGYRQLLLTSADAEAVGQVLGLEEALLTMLIGSRHGYVMVVRGGQVRARRVALNEASAAALVRRIRASIEPGADGRMPERFNAEASHALYRALLQPVASAFEGAATLVVAPDGALLSIPFGLLLAAQPANPAVLAAADWLIRRHAIVHVPSPQTLTTLRSAGTGSTASRAYIGFGDFVPPNASQFARLFPRDRCGDDQRLAQGLGRLPGTRAEVLTARELLGAPAAAAILGAEFTAARLRQSQLDQHRIVHLATHALLAGELSCLPEPAILMSAPASAPDAGPAFLRASEVLALKMDADLVILSACNTGGPGSGGGEALSGLARAFFYAGARGLLVTHWSVDDAAAALTVADALRRQQGGAASVGALRGAQLLILDEAGKRLPAAFAHPYYWAPFALIGDGRRTGTRSAEMGDATVDRM